ncbi:hypothetical protein POVWA2_044050 [Plasmodium ovale wallikeri]|uniref:Uncharacterized protein n=1 Tax=Plasmodium ovale wallikeri TaxID=864142 RepID=A0A1A8ZFI9_PLAOA|nr:hypothetical protein POVWA1_045480 [Plasmodium ovale wallikeri]SBT42572.1 hypothetical protein POVWA2_044050 [Plasmodium ovale wallikeri]
MYIEPKLQLVKICVTMQRSVHIQQNLNYKKASDAAYALAYTYKENTNTHEVILTCTRKNALAYMYKLKLL